MLSSRAVSSQAFLSPQPRLPPGSAQGGQQHPCARRGLRMAPGREAPGKPVQDMTSSRKTRNLREESIAETRNGMAGLFFFCVCVRFLPVFIGAQQFLPQEKGYQTQNEAGREKRRRLDSSPSKGLAGCHTARLRPGHAQHMGVLTHFFISSFHFFFFLFCFHPLLSWCSTMTLINPCF